MGKKLTSILMSIVLVVGLCPGLAYAQPTDYAAGKIAALDTGDSTDEDTDSTDEDTESDDDSDTDSDTDSTDEEVVSTYLDLRYSYAPNEEISNTKVFTPSFSTPYGIAITFSSDSALYGDDYLYVETGPAEDDDDFAQVVYFDADRSPANETVIIRDLGQVKIHLSTFGEGTSSVKSYGYKVIAVTPLQQYDLRTCSIYVEDPAYYYGTPVEPYVSVYPYSEDDDADSLTEGVDYRATFTMNNQIGTGMVTLTGMGDYAGSLTTRTFEIRDPHDISYAWISSDTLFSSNSAYAPEIRVYVDDSLVPRTDYTVTKYEYLDESTSEFTTVSGITVPGAYRLTIEGKSPYFGTAEGTLRVSSPYDLGAAEAYVPSLLWTGQPVSPSPELTLNGKDLVENRDYRVNYYAREDFVDADSTTVLQPLSRLVDAGDYVAAYTGISPYFNSDNSYSTFSIIKPTDAKDGYLQIDDFVATGTPTPPAMRWIYDGYDYGYEGYLELPLTPGVNCTATYYDLAYGDGTGYYYAPGEQLASVPAGPGDYYIKVAIDGVPGTVENAYWIYDTRNLWGADLGYRDSVYTDDATKNPIFWVKVGDKYLTEGVDYTLTYYKVTSGEDTWGTERLSAMPTTPGLYQVDVVGTGSESQGYYNDRKVAYSIYDPEITSATAIASATISTIPDQTYTGKEIKPTFTVTYGGTTLTEGRDYAILGYSNNVNVGTAKVVIEGYGDFRGTAEKTFSIVNPSAPAPDKTTPVATPAPTVKAPTKANPMKVKLAKTKTVKAKKLKKKAQAVKKAITVTKAQGTVKYERVKKGSSKYLTINSKTGAITVKKNTKKGTYKIKVKVTAAGKGDYKPGSKTVTAKVKVV